MIKLFSKKKVSKASINLFPRFALSNDQVVSNFMSIEEVKKRNGLIENCKVLPFVYGYLYAYDGKSFSDINELEEYNFLLEDDYLFLLGKKFYSIDGVFFKKFSDVKNYNTAMKVTYLEYFNWADSVEDSFDNFMMKM